MFNKVVQISKRKATDWFKKFRQHELALSRFLAELVTLLIANPKARVFLLTSDLQ
jgi:hypothetical protein